MAEQASAAKEQQQIQAEAELEARVAALLQDAQENTRSALPCGLTKNPSRWCSMLTTAVAACFTEGQGQWACWEVG